MSRLIGLILAIAIFFVSAGAVLAGPPPGHNGHLACVHHNGNSPSVCPH